MCKYPRYFTFILVEASTFGTDSGRKGVLQVVLHMIDRETVPTHAQWDITLDAPCRHYFASLLSAGTRHIVALCWARLVYVVRERFHVLGFSLKITLPLNFTVTSFTAKC
jgi:hypothetical protein